MFSDVSCFLNKSKLQVVFSDSECQPQVPTCLTLLLESVDHCRCFSRIYLKLRKRAIEAWNATWTPRNSHQPQRRPSANAKDCHATCPKEIERTIAMQIIQLTHKYSQLTWLNCVTCGDTSFTHQQYQVLDVCLRPDGEICSWFDKYRHGGFGTGGKATESRRWRHGRDGKPRMCKKKCPVFPVAWCMLSTRLNTLPVFTFLIFLPL